MRGASSPMSTITASTKSATRDEGLRMIWRTPSASGDSRGCAVLVVTEPRVGPRIEQIGEQTSQSDHDAAYDHSTDDERVVAGADRADDCQSHSRPRKNLLDEEGAGEQSGEREPDQRDDGQQRVAQCVAPQNLAFGQSLQPGGADVVGR